MSSLTCTCTNDVLGSLGIESGWGSSRVRNRLAEVVESGSLRAEHLVVWPQQDDDKHQELEAVAKLINARMSIDRLPVLPENPHTRRRVLRLGGRLILNQNSGIIENAGLTLHRHFGYPYIPGSSVKGIARIGAKWEDADDTNMRAVFGNEPGVGEGFVKGQVAFMAAVPAETPRVVVDIVNCHHGEYYRSDDPNARALDNESPVPNFFLAVERDAPFLFQIRALPCAGEDAEHLLNLAERWLVAGLTLHGIGGKTAAGYGWFEEDPNLETRVLEGLRKKEEERARKKEEEEQIATMSPEERAAEAYWERLPNEGQMSTLKGHLGRLAELAAEDRCAIVYLMRGRCAEWWRQLVVNAREVEQRIAQAEAQLEGAQQRGKKGKKAAKKAERRIQKIKEKESAPEWVAAVRQAARELEVKLP